MIRWDSLICGPSSSTGEERDEGKAGERRTGKEGRVGVGKGREEWSEVEGMEGRGEEMGRGGETMLTWSPG